MIDMLKHAKTKEDVIAIIAKRYFELVEGDYIPALLEEGSISGDADNKADFYAKLIIVPSNDSKTGINKTWMTSNLSLHTPSTCDDGKSQVYNVIVYRNYKHKKLYQLNPAFLSDEYIVEHDQKDSMFASQYLPKESHNSINDVPIFKSGRPPASLLLNMYALENYIELPGKKQLWDIEFELFLEFEYRSNESFPIPAFKGLIMGSFIDVEIIKDQEIKIWIRGTMPLNIKDIAIHHANEAYNDIKVFGLDNGMIRALNPSNFNDDMEAGFVVFKNTALPILKSDYYFYDLIIVSKNDLDNYLMIDTFAEYFIFWEGEFNKLPKEIKNSLIQHNVIVKPKHIISSVMFTWQLEASWNYMDKATPRTKLANYVKSNNFNAAIENGLDFCIPLSNLEMKKFLDVIEVLYNVSPFDYDQASEDIKLLCSIKDVSLKNELTPDQYLTLFEKFCNAVLKRVGSDE